MDSFLAMLGVVVIITIGVTAFFFVALFFARKIISGIERGRQRQRKEPLQ